jgi:hypothetical protein
MGKAADKYQFFMKATELERIDNSFARTVEQLEEMENQAVRLCQAIETDRQLARECKEAVNQHFEIDKLEGKKSKLEAQASWATYKVALEELEDRQQVCVCVCECDDAFLIL